MSAASKTTNRSTDVRLPLWLRIVALAVEHAETNVLGGKAATFDHGELRRRLDPYDLGLPASSVTRAITTGIAYGMLHKGSNTKALYLVPGPLTVEAER